MEAFISGGAPWRRGPGPAAAHDPENILEFCDVQTYNCQKKSVVSKVVPHGKVEGEESASIKLINGKMDNKETHEESNWNAEPL